MRKDMRVAGGPRIGDLPIRSKLVALLAVPLGALVIVGLLVTGSSAIAAFGAQRVEQVSGVAVQASTLVHELQSERGAAVAVVAGQAAGDASPDAAAEFEAAQQRVDEQVAAINEQLETLLVSDAYATLREKLDASGLDQLPQVREQIGPTPPLTVSETAALYEPAISGLLGLVGDLAAGVDDERLLRAVSAAVALGQAKDAAAQTQALIGAAAGAGRFPPGEFQRLVTLVAAEQTWLAQFTESATPQQQELYDETVAGQEADRAGALRAAVLAAGGRGVPVEAKQWAAATLETQERLRRVEAALAGDVAAAGGGIKTAAEREAVAGGIGLSAVVAVAIGVSAQIARSMSGPLALLAASATRVAHHRLPEVVERMQRAELVDVAAETEPTGITSTDEIGQVAAALEAVQRVAVGIAAEQAGLRRAASDMILNLARRSQTLTDRLLERISDLERDETDPDTLAKLFELDHLATRMRRSAENQIVFSQADTPQRWNEPVVLGDDAPVPLPDVVEAAIAEAEDYRRVQFAGVDAVALQGRAASDVTHLLAELIDNASTFSPPDTPVVIAGQRVGRGCLIEIEDRGIGMTDDELLSANARLASPPVIDFTVSRQRLGLVVVGRLAQRYEIKVQLRHSAYRGLTALVLIPQELLADAPHDELGSQEPIAAARQRQERVLALPHPNFPRHPAG